MDIKMIVEAALKRAINMDYDCGASFEDPPSTSKKELHHWRSQRFVACLARELKHRYHDRPGVYVLSRDSSEHKKPFGVNELLYDVLVCEATRIPSANRTKKLTAITRGLVAVESELARDSRHAVYDFNKLVLSASEMKLFVGPQVHDPESFIEPLRTLASHCSGDVHLALIPHPDKWDDLTDADATVDYWKWDGSNWA